MAASMLTTTEVESFLLESCLNQIVCHCFSGESNPNHVLNFGLPAEQEAGLQTKKKATVFELVRSRIEEDPIIRSYLLGMINMSVPYSIATREYISKNRKRLRAVRSDESKNVPDLTEDERQARMKPRKDNSTRAGAEDLIMRVEVVVLTEVLVYDTYPQVVAKLKEFLTRDGVTNKMMCKVLGGISKETLTKFLSGENTQRLGNKTYKAAYVFFEKLRILEKEDKSEERLKNEMENSTGCHYYDGKDLIMRIEAVVLTEDLVYDTYPQVVAKLKEFLTRDGVTNKMMCKVLGGISTPTLTKFLSGEYMRNLGDETYKAAYVFFEKLRILEKMDTQQDADCMDGN